jgi:hypothetical protein
MSRSATLFASSGLIAALLDCHTHRRRIPETANDCQRDKAGFQTAKKTSKETEPSTTS